MRRSMNVSIGVLESLGFLEGVETILVDGLATSGSRRQYLSLLSSREIQGMVKRATLAIISHGLVRGTLST